MIKLFKKPYSLHHYQFKCLETANKPFIIYLNKTLQHNITHFQKSKTQNNFKVSKSLTIQSKFLVNSQVVNLLYYFNTSFSKKLFQYQIFILYFFSFKKMTKGNIVGLVSILEEFRSLLRRLVGLGTIYIFKMKLITILLLFNNQMGDSEDMKYLKQDKIGKVIAKGLAAVYQTKPNKPISYFANWLLNFSKNQKQMESLKNLQNIKLDKMQEYQENQKVIEDEKNRQTQIENKIQREYLSFEDKIKQQQYHMELLLRELPQFLQKSLNLTGVYVGELNYPSKDVTQDDVDQNSHLQTDAAKLINYIGSSTSHHQLMIGKTLPTDKGVTSEVFNTAPPSNIEEGAEALPQKPKYVYVPDVVQNQKIHYFKIPKLGAYIAVPLIYKSYLSEQTFDSTLDEAKRQIQQKQQFEKQRTEKLEELQSELEEAQSKLQSHIQKQQQSLIEALNEEIKQIQARISAKQTQQLQYSAPEIVYVTKEFVVCGDTLGQDRQISQKERDFFIKYVELFKNQWEQRQMNLLKTDVNHQIQYENSLRLPVQQFQDQLAHQIENIPTEVESQLNEKYKQDQKMLSFQTQCHRLELIKNQLEKEDIKQSIMNLKKYRIVKFPLLIQSILYFLGHKKSEVDIKGTTHLNWKYVRQALINQNLIDKILHYEFRGPKYQQFRNYQKVQPLSSAFQKFQEKQVFEYNIGLGLILKYVKAALKLRKQDVEIRRAYIQELKKKREQKQQQNQKIQQQKENLLQKHKASLPQQELQSFNQQQWVQEYQQQHPFVDIPPKVKQDVDNDI